MYKVTFKPSADKAFRALLSDVQRAIATKEIPSLEENPRNHKVKKLRDYKIEGQDLYRIRYSYYRMIFTIDDTCGKVTILVVGHRRDVYR
jgi:mRNA-degrading endonuclease RelE of RelBE toxin-antitoxin system